MWLSMLRFCWIVDGDASDIVKLDGEGKIMNGSAPSGAVERRTTASTTHKASFLVLLATSTSQPWIALVGSDRGNHRIQIFDSGFSYLATIGQTGVCGTGNDQFCGPRHIAVYGASSLSPMPATSASSLPYLHANRSHLCGNPGTTRAWAGTITPTSTVPPACGGCGVYLRGR